MVERIEDCLSFQLGKAYQQVNQAAKRRLAPHGVTPVQYAVLKVLWEHNDQSGAELGDRLQLDSATITGVLDRLERGGLVERRADPADRRINRLSLTPQGSSLQGPLDREMEALNADFLSLLSDDDGRRLRTLLIELAHGITA